MPQVVPEQRLSLQQLAKHDGSDPGKAILLAVRSTVFDVTKGALAALLISQPFPRLHPALPGPASPRTAHSTVVIDAADSSKAACILKMLWSNTYHTSKRQGDFRATGKAGAEAAFRPRRQALCQLHLQHLDDIAAKSAKPNVLAETSECGGHPGSSPSSLRVPKAGELSEIVKYPEPVAVNFMGCLSNCKRTEAVKYLQCM